MLNHFRTLLLNMPSVAASDQIPSKFTTQVYSPVIRKVLDLLLPVTVREDKLIQVHNLLQLLIASNLYSVIYMFDPRVTYVPWDNKASYFKTGHPVSFTSVFSALQANRDLIDTMLKLDASIDTALYEDIWRTHSNMVYRLAALSICLVARMEAERIK